MKKRTVCVLVVLALAVAGAGLYYKLRPTEVKRVRKQVGRLAERFSKNPGEGPGMMAAKMHTFGELLSDPIELDLQDFPGNGRRSQVEIVSHVARVRGMFRFLRLTFYDVHITVDTADSAVVRLTARLATESTDGAAADDTREVDCYLRKIDDDWRFTAFREVQVMER